MSSLLTFHSTHAVLKAERLLLETGVQAEAISVPRTISSDCGIGLRLKEEDVPRCRQLLASRGIEVAGVHQL